MQTFTLGKYDHVDLCDLLKLEGLTESGAMAKLVIDAKKVKVDGQVETRKRCKIYPQQIVSFAGQQIKVTK